MKTIMRAALMLTSCGALLALGPGTAWAEGETVVTYTGSPGSGSEISVKATPGKANAVIWTVEDRCDGTLTTICIRDAAAGITESSPHCAQQSPTEVRCQAQGLNKIEINLGDRGDTLGVLLNVPDVTVIPNLIVWGGAGNDRVRTFASFGVSDEKYHIVVSGGSGTDRVVHEFRQPIVQAAKSVTLRGGNGPDQLKLTGPGSMLGQAGNDILRGFAGPQRLFGNDGQDWFSCGKGKDLANGGPGKDVAQRNCEQIVNGVPPDTPRHQG